MTLAIILFIGGILLSAFFSGAETGFYRVTRVRLVIDALEGDWVSKRLLWFTNHPSLFVATALIGNNIANYLVSLAIVMGTDRVLNTASTWPGVIMPILLAPLIFVCGESTPKTVFYLAPNRLLKKCGIPLMGTAILFAPATALLWVISRVLELIVGQSPQKVTLALARRELAKVIEEGHDAGILLPGQRALAQGLFEVANRPISQLMTPIAKTPLATATMTRSEVLKLANRHRLAAIPAVEHGEATKIAGYWSAAELVLHRDEELPRPRPLVTVPQSQPVIVVLSILQQSEPSFAKIVDATGKAVGFVTARQLSKALFRGQ